ncbi:MAG: Uncharacterised protein [Owenweeksia sp. TMED14]|nr:MAG: Uncharacterised protein [Owenweeksia sp. TMED14]
MESIIKLPSQQSSFTATNNTVDLVLPGNSGVYDLSQMYIVIDTSVTSNFDNQTGGNRLGTGLELTDAIADLKLKFNHGVANSIYNDTACPIEMLIKDCRMTSQSRGPVEDVRNSDSLRATMKSYTQDLDDVEGAALVGMAGAAKTNPWANGRYAKLQGVGDVLSTSQTHELRIYLRDLYEICSVTDWDTAVYGDTTFSMTLRIDALVIEQVLNAGPVPWTNYYHNTINTATEGPIIPYGRAVQRAFANSTPPVETTMTMAAVYPNIEDHPFWTGQILNITTSEGVDPDTGAASTGTAVGQVPALASTKWCVVKAISWDAVTKLVTLDFGTTILDVKTVTGSTGTGYFIDRNVVGVNTQGATLLLNSVELNAVRRSDVASGPSSIQYSQWSTQADQFSSGSSLNRTYYLPARTSEVVIVLPSNSEYGSDVLGSQRLSSYRFAVNGESVTNRAVPYMSVVATNDIANDGKGDAGSSLHYDLISKTMMNMGKRYSSLNECVYDQAIPINTAVPQSTTQGRRGWLTIADQPQKRVYALMCPIPFSEEQTQFNLELDGQFAVGTGRVLMYSHVASTI